MTISQEDVFLRLVTPILIGFIGAFLSALIAWITEVVNKRKTNREEQHMKATEICGKVIDALDEISSYLKNDVWYISWRKYRAAAAAAAQNDDDTKNQPDYPDELVEEDKEKWAMYKKSIDEWRTHLIGYETEMKSFFGTDGYEAFLFLDAARLIEKAVDMVRRIYYAPTTGNKVTTIVVPSMKDGKPVMEKLVLDFSEDGQLQNMEEFFDLVERLCDRVTDLSLTMIHCIQNGQVGNLATKQEPVPDHWQEEAQALFGRRQGSSRTELASKESKHNMAGSKLEREKLVHDDEIYISEEV